MFGEDEVVRSHQGRIDAILNIMVIAFAVVFARLWYLQIYQGDTLYKYSIENRLRKEVLHANRGIIFSRDNHQFVYNSPRFDAVIIPQYLGQKKKTIKKLAETLEMKPKEINKILRKNSFQASYRPVVIKKNISDKEVAVIETEGAQLPGVQVQTFIGREYAEGEIGAHILGYISEISQFQLPKFRERDKFDYKLGDFIGQFGLEEKFDLSLRGTDGHKYVEVDARGRIKRRPRDDIFYKGIEDLEAKAGGNIRLTIDHDLQRRAFESLEGKVGSAVAVDVNTGEVLAMISRPSFRPSEFSKGLSQKYWSSLRNNEFNPMRDRAIQEHYSPGSTFKAFTAIAALEEGIVDEDFEVNCRTVFRLGRRKFHCWKKAGHRKVKLVKALRESCDIYFYKIATKLDIDVLARYASAFGLGKRTGINLPRETSGLIPTKEWKKKRSGVDWQLGETLSCVIGQSYVLTTPLQLAMSYAAMANGGKLLRPRIIRETFSNSGEILSRPKTEVVRSINLSEKTLKLVRQGLIEVVNHPKGTARWYTRKGIKMAGKTGTTQVVSMSSEKLFTKCKEWPYKLRNHAFFTAYAPYDNPKVAVAVAVEHGCSGSSAAAPVARDIVETYIKKYGATGKNPEIIVGPNAEVFP